MKGHVHRYYVAPSVITLVRLVESLRERARQADARSSEIEAGASPDTTMVYGLRGESVAMLKVANEIEALISYRNPHLEV